MKNKKTALLALMPVLGLLGLSASAFAATSGTATFQITTIIPTLGIAVTAPSPITTVALDSGAPDDEEYGSTYTTITNTGNQNEYLNMSLASSTVTGTGGNTATLVTNNNLGIVTGTGFIFNTSGAVISGTGQTATALPAGSFGVYLMPAKGYPAAPSSGTVPMLALTTSNVDLGPSGLNNPNFLSAPLMPGEQASPGFGFVYGNGTAADTYSIPLNISVSAS